MGTNRRGAAVRDPTFDSIMRSILDLLPLRSDQHTLFLQDGPAARLCIQAAIL